MVVGVAERRPAQHQRPVEQVARAVPRLAHPLQVISELLHVVAVDPLELGDLLRIPAVVAQHVMGIGHADLRIGAVADLAADHEGADARDVGLHRQYLQIDHQPDMLVERGRNTGGPFQRRRLRIRRGQRGALDALLDIACRFQIFVELVPVGRTQVPRQPARIVQHEIQDARLPPELRRAARGVERVAVAEQSLEHVARVDRDRQRDGRVPPRDAVGIGAAIVDVATAEQAGLVDPQLQRRQWRRLAQRLREHLVHRDAAADVAPLRLADVDAGQEGGAGPAVPRRRVAQRGGTGVAQPGDHRHLLAERRQRLQRRRQHQRARARRAEAVHHHAVGRIEDLQPLRPRGGLRRGRRRDHRVEQRQRHRRADAAQQCAPAHRGTNHPHDVGAFLSVKASLATMPRTIVWMR